MSKMISAASGFQYSVNIGYDSKNKDKLKNFIPTKSALELLEDILLRIHSTSTERVRILNGAYGKGKSHLPSYRGPQFRFSAALLQAPYLFQG